MFVENQIRNILLRKYHMCIALRILATHGPEIILKKAVFRFTHRQIYDRLAQLAFNPVIDNVPQTVWTKANAFFLARRERYQV